jgi:hypothetical protein
MLVIFDIGVSADARRDRPGIRPARDRAMRCRVPRCIALLSLESEYLVFERAVDGEDRTLYRTERFEGAFSPMYFRRIGPIVFPIATRSMTASVCSHAPCTAKTATSRPIGGSLIEHPGRIFPTARNYASQR